MLSLRLDPEAAEFPHNGTRSRGDEIHKLFVKSSYFFIISTLFHVFISVLAVSVKDLLYPNLLVLASGYSFGYVDPVLHHVLSTAELKDLKTQPTELFNMSINCFSS
jgi:hypothetical protein